MDAGLLEPPTLFSAEEYEALSPGPENGEEYKAQSHQHDGQYLTWAQAESKPFAEHVVVL
jgi:hypothetical protein